MLVFGTRMILMRLRELFLGAKEPNKNQLKAISALCSNLGLLLIASIVIRFFVPSTEEMVSGLVFAGGILLAALFFAWSVRLLREVVDK